MAGLYPREVALSPSDSTSWVAPGSPHSAPAGGRAPSDCCHPTQTERQGTVNINTWPDGYNTWQPFFFWQYNVSLSIKTQQCYSAAIYGRPDKSMYVTHALHIRTYCCIRCDKSWDVKQRYCDNTVLLNWPMCIGKYTHLALQCTASHSAQPSPPPMPAQLWLCTRESITYVGWTLTFHAQCNTFQEYIKIPIHWDVSLTLLFLAHSYTSVISSGTQLLTSASCFINFLSFSIVVARSLFLAQSTLHRGICASSSPQEMSSLATMPMFAHEPCRVRITYSGWDVLGWSTNTVEPRT